MKKLLKKFTLTCLALSLAGCGGSSSTDNQQVNEEANELATFSLGLSDAPVDEAVAVFIELDSIKLINTDQSQGQQETVIETFTDTAGVEVETIQVNLLDFQGSSQIKIVDEAQNIALVNGTYEMELTVVDAGSYVLLDNDAAQHAIKVPSSRLRLGEFTVNDEAIQINNTPAYTVEFDLRQSLVLRGNLNNNNGFIIKPHGVRIVSLSGAIEGSVSTNFTNLGDCTVYIYEANAIEYGDVFDINDENFVVPAQEITASSPLATTKVSVDGQYSIGFVPTGSYQTALTCGTDVDDNIQFDGLTIPSAAEITPDLQITEVTSGQVTTINF